MIAKNTVKGTVRECFSSLSVEAWYNDRYGKTLDLTSINKTNASDLLKHFFLEIRDMRKNKIARLKLKTIRIFLIQTRDCFESLF